MKGEDFNFVEKDVQEIQRKNLGRLHNVLAMYQMFADNTKASDDSKHALDQWILTRLNQVVLESTSGYKNYELDKATRPLTELIDDLSVWYLRRSRDRLKGNDASDKTQALATLRYTLRTLALTMAPVMPFYADYLWQAVKEEDDAESVHLAKWPKAAKIDIDLLEKMRQTREVVTATLEARTKAGIKVRQPIASVSGPSLGSELEALVLDELNAKQYVVAPEPNIDTDLTPKLVAEGAVRELMRAVQGARKAAKLEPADLIQLTIQTNEAGETAIKNHQQLLVTTVGATELIFDNTDGNELDAGNYNFVFSLKKV